MSTLFSIESIITPNLSHLIQDPQNDLRSPGQFMGKISDSSVEIDGHKYRVIDDAIAVKEKMISAWAQKWLLRTTGVVFGALTIGAIVAGIAATPLVALAAIPIAALCYFSFKSSFNITDEDPHTIAALRKQWNPNMQLQPFASVYTAHDKSTHDIKKFMTTTEIEYAFQKEFKFSNFANIIKYVKLDDAHQYLDADTLNQKWKEELRFSTVDHFFNTYDKGAHCSLQQMRNLGILTTSDNAILQKARDSFSSIDNSYEKQRLTIHSSETSELNQISQTKNLKVRNAELEHSNNFFVGMRRNMMLRHMITDTNKDNQMMLINAGLDIASFIGAQTADRARDEKLVEARVEYQVALKGITSVYQKRYTALQSERLESVNTLSPLLRDTIERLHASRMLKVA